MRRSTRSAALAAALLAGAAACSYSYRNPAEALGPGEVGGRAVGDAGALDGVAISLKGAALDATSRPNGHFAMLPLPTGRHTLLFRKGTERALRRDVEIGWGQDGQPQGVWMGDVAIPAGVTLTGSCAPPGGLLLAADGVVEDEASGAGALLSGGAAGAFTLAGLAAGEHRLRCAAMDALGNVYVGGPRAVYVGAADAGTVRALASPIELHRATPATATVILRVRVVGAAGLSPAQLAVVGLPLPARPALDSSGLAQVEVREGRWTVGLRLPPGTQGVTTPPPVTFVAVAGDTVDLGTLYAVADGARSRAALACHDDGDCAPGRCAGGTCDGWTAPQAAPATAGVCDPATAGCTPGPLGGIVDRNVGTAGAPYPATCVAGTFPGGSAGVGCGACCTPDGAAVICGRPGAGGCPALGGAPGSVCSADGWCWENPLPQGQDLRALWGTSADGIWATGVGAGILRWDGAAWTQAAGAAGSFEGLWGTSPRDVWAGGYGLLHWDGTAWTTVATPGAFYLPTGWASSPTDVWAFAASSSGTAWHWDGAAWTTTSLGPLSARSTWAAAADDLWVGGDEWGTGRGLLAHWDGSAWTTTSTASPVLSIWGSSAGDVWAATTGGLLHRSAAWSPVPTPVDGTGARLNAVAGRGAGEVWAVGQDAAGAGLALHWSAGSWAATATGTPPLRAVWGDGKGDFWAAGDGGATVRLDAAGWRSPAVTTADLDGVWGASPVDAWAVGARGTLLHWNGAHWLSVGTGRTEGLHGIWGAAANDAWIVGDGGAVLRWDGVEWAATTSPTASTLRAVSGSSASLVWAVGDDGALVLWDGHALTTVESGTTAALRAVWASGPSRAFAAGDLPAGGGVFLTWDGMSWTVAPQGGDNAGLWGTSATDVWLASLFEMSRWDGATWTSYSMPGESRMLGVWGTSPADAWAVGDGGTLLHWDGAGWTERASGVPGDLRAIWGASPDDVWAVGARGAIVHLSR